MMTIEYFLFESDFVEENIRCIPMVVRLKLDLTGIKMALSTWSGCSYVERKQLALLPCSSVIERQLYSQFVVTVIIRYSGQLPHYIPIERNPLWEDEKIIPDLLLQQAGKFGWTICHEQWKHLSLLQRFALLKLCRPGHENRNFPLAMREFGLVVN